jgi:hypothetical protein
MTGAMRFLILQAEATEGASSFFDSPWWKFTTMMAKAMLVAMWLALAFWTYKDARRRITDPLMIGVAVATSLVFPYVGTLFYVILRPPEYLEDVLERDLEIRAREQELVGGANRCPACRAPVRDDYLVCPKCRRELKVSCSSCSKPLDPSWKICPYCATEPGGTRNKAKAVIGEEDELFA